MSDGTGRWLPEIGTEMRVLTGRSVVRGELVHVAMADHDGSPVLLIEERYSSHPTRIPWHAVVEIREGDEDE